MLLFQSIILLFTVAGSVLFPDVACDEDFGWAPLFGNENFVRHRNPFSAFFSYRPRGEDSDVASDFLIPPRSDELYEPAGYRSVVRYHQELPGRGRHSYYRDVMRKHGRRNNMLYKLKLENELSRINNEEEKLEERKRVINLVIDNIDGFTNFGDKRRVSERNRYAGYLNRNYFTESEEPQNEFGFGNMGLNSVDDDPEENVDDVENDIKPEITYSNDFENERKPKNNDISYEFVDNDMKPETESNAKRFNDEEKTKNDVDDDVDDNDTPETTDSDESFKNKNNDLDDSNYENRETIPNNRLEDYIRLNNERKHKNNDFHIKFALNRHYVKPEHTTNDDFVNNEVEPQRTTNENDIINSEDESTNNERKHKHNDFHIKFSLNRHYVKPEHTINDDFVNNEVEPQRTTNENDIINSEDESINNEEKVKSTKRIEDFFDRNFGVDNEKNDVQSNDDSTDNVKSQSNANDDIPNKYFDSDNEETKNTIEENNMEERKNEDNENSEKSKLNEFFGDENRNNKPKTQPTNIFFDEETPVPNNDLAVTRSNTFLKPHKKIVALHHYPGFMDFLESLF